MPRRVQTAGEHASRLRRGLGDPVDIAATLSTLSLARLKAGDAHGAGAGRDRGAGDLPPHWATGVGEAIGLLHLGQIACHDRRLMRRPRELPGARRWRSRARSSTARSKASANCCWAKLAFEAGDLRREPASASTRSLSVCREAADKRGEANALWWLGKVELQAGRLESARAQLGEALKAFREFEMWEELLGCLEDLAVLARASVLERRRRPGGGHGHHRRASAWA